jgi:hypothetical protein
VITKIVMALKELSLKKSRKNVSSEKIKKKTRILKNQGKNNAN